MTTSEKLKTVSENMPKVYDAGKKSEYDRFWDAYQENGNRTDYEYGFAGHCWNENSFKPKYDITLERNCLNIFFENKMMVDLPMYLESIGISIIYNSSVAFRETFAYSSFTRIGVIGNETSKILLMDNTFLNCKNLITIDKIKATRIKCLGAGFGNSDGVFAGCANLENITFDCEIDNSIDIFESPKLSKKSIISIINALSSHRQGATLAISKTAVNNAFGINVDDETTFPPGSEYYNLRHSKDNWTFSYM